MYPYHGRIKQRILNGELLDWQMVDDYPGIGECMVFHFSTSPYFRPVRPHRFEEYRNFLSHQELIQTSK